MRKQKQKPCICEAADMAHPRAVSSVDPHRHLDSLVLDETPVFQLAYRANSCVSRPRKNSKVIAAHLTAKGKCAQHTDFYFRRRIHCGAPLLSLGQPPLNKPYLINNLPFYSGGCHVGKVSSELSYSYRDIGISALAKLQNPCASAGLRVCRLV